MKVEGRGWACPSDTGLVGGGVFQILPRRASLHHNSHLSGIRVVSG